MTLKLGSHNNLYPQSLISVGKFCETKFREFGHQVSYKKKRVSQLISLSVWAGIISVHSLWYDVHKNSGKIQGHGVRG